MTTPQCKCFRAACRIHFRSVHRKKQAKTWTERRPRRCFLRDRNHPSSFSVLEGWAQYTSLNWRQKGWRRQRIHRKGSWFCSFQHSIKKKTNTYCTITAEHIVCWCISWHGEWCLVKNIQWATFPSKDVHCRASKERKKPWQLDRRFSEDTKRHFSVTKVL